MDLQKVKSEILAKQEMLSKEESKLWEDEISEWEKLVERNNLTGTFKQEDIDQILKNVQLPGHMSIEKLKGLRESIKRYSVLPNSFGNEDHQFTIVPPENPGSALDRVRDIVK